MRIDDLMGEKIESEEATDEQLEELAEQYRRYLRRPADLPEGPWIYQQGLADIEEELALREKALSG